MTTEPTVKCQAPGGASEGHTCICEVALSEHHEVHRCRCGTEWAVLQGKVKPEPHDRDVMEDVAGILNREQRRIAREQLRMEMTVAHVQGVTGCPHKVAREALRTAFEVFRGEAEDSGLPFRQYMQELPLDQRWVIIGMCVGRLWEQLES